MGNYAIFSDIHGNLTALLEVLRDAERYKIDGVLLLGDLIDYGMRSNETVACLAAWLEGKNIVCNLWGNHERAILTGDFTRFSSPRGADSARYTASRLSEASKTYLTNALSHEGFREFELEGKRCLAIHGSLEDPYWKSVFPDNVRGDYSRYDVVFSGHSHFSHTFRKFYPCDNPETRNQHAVCFINPGSVGQPRNHLPHAQYAVLDCDTMGVAMRSVPYNVGAEMALYHGEVDFFYRNRLKNGV